MSLCDSRPWIMVVTDSSRDVIVTRNHWSRRSLSERRRGWPNRHRGSRFGDHCSRRNTLLYSTHCHLSITHSERRIIQWMLVTADTLLSNVSISMTLINNQRKRKPPRCAESSRTCQGNRFLQNRRKTRKRDRSKRRVHELNTKECPLYQVAVALHQ